MSKFDSGFRYEDTGFTNPVVQIGLDRVLIKIIRGYDEIKTLCDIGCGNGRLALQLAESGYRVIGVDSSPSGISVATEAIGNRDAKFICGEIGDRLPELLIPNNALFDAVVTNDVVEHMYRPRALVEVALKILKPGGILIVCTPYHGYLKNLLLSIFDKWDGHHGVHWDGGHIKFFSVNTLSSLVAGHGFDIDRFHYFGRAPWLWKNMICVARKR